MIKKISASLGIGKTAVVELAVREMSRTKEANQ
jgi:Ni2+-binding GTPase involved in maturation of urease and hydrogenase